MKPQPVAYLRVRRLDTQEIVHSVPLQQSDLHHVERVMMGMLINMNTDKFYIDDSEADAAREEE